MENVEPITLVFAAFALVMVVASATAAYFAGRKAGEAEGYKAAAEKIERAHTDASTIRDIEWVVEAVPGRVVETLLQGVHEGYQKALALNVVPERLKVLTDQVAILIDKASDGIPESSKPPVTVTAETASITVQAPDEQING